VAAGCAQPLRDELRFGADQPLGHWSEPPADGSIAVMPTPTQQHSAVENGSARGRRPEVAASRIRGEGVNLSMNKFKVTAVGVALSAAMFLPAIAEAGPKHW
jgi:hypothetical protein